MVFVFFVTSVLWEVTDKGILKVIFNQKALELLHQAWVIEIAVCDAGVWNSVAATVLDKAVEALGQVPTTLGNTST